MSSLKAPGSANAMKNAAAAPARIPARFTRLSTSIAVVVQTYPDHAHHTSASISSERANPPALRSERRSDVIWVIANTNTRSKNSSR